MIAAVFPGQGSQKPGMGAELLAHEEAQEVFATASQAINLDLAKLCLQSDEETLRRTENAQVALFVCGVAAHRLLPVGDVFAGHSVGEYAALAAAGIIDVAEGAQLVRYRGEIMAGAGTDRKGTMAAVLGLERDPLAQVCQEASTEDEVVVIANDNCPGQLVISGDVAAVERASALASAAGAKRVLPLNVSGAFHSPLMDQPAERMGARLRRSPFVVGKPAVANVSAQEESNPAIWAQLLEDQLRNPVRWTESVLHMKEKGVTTYVEFGVGEVLGGLIRRTDREAKTLAVYDDASLAKAKEELG